MNSICVIECNNQEGFQTKQIEINQYYPTDINKLFDKEISKETKDKWNKYLDQFNIGKLKTYIRLSTESHLNLGWIYLLSREVAYRNDLLSNIYEMELERNTTPFFTWIMWSSKWIYMGLELENNINVISIPKNKI
jgi:hypothetical protein